MIDIIDEVFGLYQKLLNFDLFTIKFEIQSLIVHGFLKNLILGLRPRDLKFFTQV